MSFSVLIYNTLFNKAFLKIEEIINSHHPDILCLQEVNTEKQNLLRLNKLGYRLAEYSNSFIKFGQVYGAATFYKPETFEFTYSQSLKISSNLSELLFTIPQIILGINKPKTVLRTDFIDRKTKKSFTICNAHLIVIASNDLRINHIQKALKSLEIPNNTPLILGGDFNYLPYRRKKLELVMKKYGLLEATKNIRQTINFSKSGKKEELSYLQGFFIRRINQLFNFQMKNDYVFFRGLKLLKTKRIDSRLSDHYPIYIDFKI